MNKLQESLIEALKILIKCDIDLIENQPKEECINHRFAQYLEQVLKHENSLRELKINVDVEYDKYKENEKKSPEGNNIRPDIIAHKRKSGNKNNLIVIEAKKKYNDQKDIRNITNLVNNKKFNYSLGAGVAYLPDKNYMRIRFLLRDNTWENYRLNKTNFTIEKTE